MGLPYDELPGPFMRAYVCPDCGGPMDAYEQDWKADYYKCPECDCIARVERDREGNTVGDLDLVTKDFLIPWKVWPEWDTRKKPDERRDNQ